MSDDNKLRGFAKVTRDLTERRQVELLQIADKQKNEFLAMLAHELRNPLAPISNALQLLKMRDVDESATLEITEMMERQVFHLVHLVDDLMDMSRIVKKHFSVFYTSEDLVSELPRRELEEASAKGRVENEGWRVRKDRSQFWANVVITPINSGAGQVRRLHGFSRHAGATGFFHAPLGDICPIK